VIALAIGYKLSRAEERCVDSAESAASAFCVKESRRSRYPPLPITQASGESILGSLDLLHIGITSTRHSGLSSPFSIYTPPSSTQ